MSNANEARRMLKRYMRNIARQMASIEQDEIERDELELDKWVIPGSGSTPKDFDEQEIEEVEEQALQTALAEAAQLSAGWIEFPDARSAEAASSNLARPSERAGKPSSESTSVVKKAKPQRTNTALSVVPTDKPQPNKRSMLSIQKRVFEYKEWLTLVRSTGAGYGARSFQNDLARDLCADYGGRALNRQLGRLFLKQIAFLPWQAEELFGPYYKPFCGCKLLQSEKLSQETLRALELFTEGDLARAARGASSVDVLRPSQKLFRFALACNPKLHFLLTRALALAYHDALPALEKLPELGRSFWLFLAYLVKHPQPSELALNVALDVNPPGGAAQLEAEIQSAAPRLLTLLRYFWFQDRPDALPAPYAPGALKLAPRDLLYETVKVPPLMSYLKAQVPELMSMGALSVLVGDELVATLVLAPQLEAHCIGLLMEQAQEKQPAQEAFYNPAWIQRALPFEQQLEAILDTCFSCMRRGELELLAGGAIAQRSLKKLGKQLFPQCADSIASAVVERVCFQLMVVCGVHSGSIKDLPPQIFEQLFLNNAYFFGGGAWRYRESLKQILRLPVDRWVALEKVWPRWDKNSSGMSIDQIYESLTLGFAIGALDIAFEPNGKRPGHPVGVRLSKAALMDFLLPGSAERVGQNGDPASVAVAQAELKAPAFSFSANVLHNCSILLPPDLHPALRLCVAVLFKSSGLRSFQIDPQVSSASTKLDLDAEEVISFLRLLSGAELAPQVLSMLKELCAGGESAGVFTPDYVLTGIDATRVAALLKRETSSRLAAVEIAPSVWGFYEYRYSRSSIGEHEVHAHEVMSGPLKRMLKELTQARVQPRTSFEGRAILTNHEARNERSTKPQDTQHGKRLPGFFEIELAQAKEIAVNPWSLLPTEFAQHSVVHRILSCLQGWQ